MAKYIVEALPVTKTWLGEGPHWDAKSEQLYYVDILRKSVYRYNPATSEESKIVIQEKGQGEDSVTLVVPVENEPNKFIISLGRALCVLNWDGKTGSGFASDLKTLKVVDDGNPNGRFNDGKCDSRGRLWAGTMGYYQAGNIGSLESKRGLLYKLDQDGSLSNQLKDVDLSNGLAWSPDNTVFYYIDSIAFSVDAFDFDIESGSISNRRKIFDFKAKGVQGIPDGMCIDEKGNLWVAVFSGAKVIHIDPRDGKLIDQIDLPTSNITSVAFGGRNLDVLYVTSAQNDLTKEQLQAQPTAGSVFKVTNLGVKGLSPGVAYGGKV